jgi:hypothetical protein
VHTGGLAGAAGRELAVAVLTNHARSAARFMARSGVLGLGLVLASCATVKPYQRGRLAERCMRVERDAQAASMEAHVYEYREGATGATGTTGGGCGCN